MAGLDLDAARAARAAERRQQDAAGREARGETLPITLGGETIATLTAEFPLTVLGPLREIDSEIALLVNKAMSVVQDRRGGGTGGDDAMDATMLVIDLLALNPALPTKVVDIAREMGVRLLGADGLAAFLAAEPTGQDVAALVKGVTDWYGVSLGEASRSSESPTSAGGTSNGTSGSTPEDSTPETRSEPVTTPG